MEEADDVGTDRCNVGTDMFNVGTNRCIVGTDSDVNRAARYSYW